MFSRFTRIKRPNSVRKRSTTTTFLNLAHIPYLIVQPPQRDPAVSLLIEEDGLPRCRCVDLQHSESVLHVEVQQDLRSNLGQHVMTFIQPEKIHINAVLQQDTG